MIPLPFVGYTTIFIVTHGNRQSEQHSIGFTDTLCVHLTETSADRHHWDFEMVGGVKQGVHKVSFIIEPHPPAPSPGKGRIRCCTGYPMAYAKSFD